MFDFVLVFLLGAILGFVAGAFVVWSKYYELRAFVSALLPLFVNADKRAEFDAQTINTTKEAVKK